MKLLSTNGVLPGTNSVTGATGTYKPSSQTCSNGCGLDGSGCGPQGNEEDVNSCSTSLTGGELNGEEACENNGYQESQCLNVGDGSCCDWDVNQCWSSIGQALCPGTGTPTAPTPTAPTPTPPSPTGNSCIDSQLRFKVRIKGKLRAKDCGWVSNSPSRCSLSGVSSHCPSTCGTCSTCSDGSLKFRVTLFNGKNRFKKCSYVAKKPGNRCNMDGVGDTCRSTCGTC